MIIKQLYLWHANSDWLWKTEKFFAIILIGFAGELKKVTVGHKLV